MDKDPKADCLSQASNYASVRHEAPVDDVRLSSKTLRSEYEHVNHGTSSHEEVLSVISFIERDQSIASQDVSSSRVTLFPQERFRIQLFENGSAEATMNMFGKGARFREMRNINALNLSPCRHHLQQK